MKFKSTVRYYRAPVRMRITLKKTPITDNNSNSVGEELEKREPLHAAGANVKWCSCWENQYELS